MEYFWAELVGTMILIILGDGVVANVVLAKTKGNNSGWSVSATGWGLAVAIAVYCGGRVSGAHINPAVTVGLASVELIEWAKVPVYIAGQMAGAFLGGVVVWLAYLSHWGVTEDPGAKLAVFSTGECMYLLGTPISPVATPPRLSCIAFASVPVPRGAACI